MRKLVAVLVTAAIGAAGVAAMAVASPGSGASATVLARGLATKRVKTRGNEPYDVVVQQLTIAPGGHAGWHTHPGSALAVVRSGTLTIYDGDDRSCSPHTYSAGETYVDPGHGHVHIGRNEGAAPLEIVVAYVDVPPGEPVRLDAPDPGNCD